MQLIQDDEEMATVFVSFHDGQDRSIGWQKKKQGSSSWRLDRQPVTSFAPIAKSLPVQWLDTSSHRDYASGPKERRRFFDWGLFHVEPDFHGVWSSYQTAISQRNAALKQKQRLGQWDQQCVYWGERLDAMRRSYFERYSQVFEQYVASLSLVDLSVSLHYERGWPDSVSLAESLASSLGQDQRMGFTSCGPHRADVVITTPKGPAHQRLSQGQQKMLAYAWRLAQGEMLQSKRGSHGIILIDDLTAELDPPFFLICETTKDAEASASVSSFNTSSSELVFVTVASSLTLSVSFTATGSSLTPVTVIVKFAESVSVPSLIV